VHLVCAYETGARALPSQYEIMSEIDKEAENINDIMNNKIVIATTVQKP
jgi:hypothetical protein